MYLDRVRVLHPDLQREPSRKLQAEFQMKRVNRAYAVLSDPDRRRRYDAELASGEGEKPEAPLVNRKKGRSRARAVITLGWLICAFAGTVGIGWYVSQQTLLPSAPEQVNAAPAPPPASQPAQPPAASEGTAELESLRSDLAAARAERDRALEQTILQAKELDFLTGRILAPPAGARRFSGVWVLPELTASSSAFTPEAVDLILNEQQGAIQGRYRARYPGMGTPEAPMVRFYLEGKSQGNVANATWSGVGGSKGEIQIKLASDDALQLVWSTTQPGKQSGPDSGTVALVRKIGP
jgi:hypothetical protein